MPKQDSGSPPVRGTYDWPVISRRLRRKPDVWMEVLQQVPRSVYSAVKRQRIKALRDQEWVYEVCTRNTTGQRADIWMKARPRTTKEMETWDSRL